MIKSSRNQNTGSHLTQPVKQALKQEAEQREITMSRLIYEILCARYLIKPLPGLRK